MPLYGIAERERNIQVMPSTSVIKMHNPYLLTEEEEKEAKQRHTDNRDRLKVPRRPAWTTDMDKAQLERIEREEFLEWRKGLAE